MISISFDTDDERREYIHGTLKHANATLDARWIEELVKRDIAGSGEDSGFTIALTKLEDQAIERRFQALTIFPFLLSAFYQISRLEGKVKDCYYIAENRFDHLNEKPKKACQEAQYEEAKIHAEKATKVKKLFQAIDDGEKLIPALVEFARAMDLKDIQESHIKRIAKAGKTVRGMQDFESLGDAARSMDINAFPSNPFEFETLLRFYGAMCSTFNAKMYSRANMGGP